MDTSVEPRIESSELLKGTRVEVHTRYQMGRWVPGFTIAEVMANGYRVRRASDGSVLNETLNPDEVRIAGTAPIRVQAAGIPDVPLRLAHSHSGARLQNRCGPASTIASPSRVGDSCSGQSTEAHGDFPELAPRPLNVLVLDSCHSTWIFDPCRLQFCRILKGLEFVGRRVPTEWRPYWQVELDRSAEGFTVYLNEARTRLIRSWRHTKDCAECGDSQTSELSLEDLYDAMPGHRGPGP
jgi:hypothetical protein